MMSFLLRPEKEVLWTKHALEKMRYYGLSKKRIKRVLKNPQRAEKGVAFRTVAIMQNAGSKKHPYEIWVMYQKISNSNLKKPKIKIISCWKYPGKSPIQREIPIPEEIRQELKKILKK